MGLDAGAALSSATSSEVAAPPSCLSASCCTTSDVTAPCQADDDDPVLSTGTAPLCPEFPLSRAHLSPHRFRKLKLLGKGAIGHVYLVLLENTDKLYAMKVMSKSDMIAKNNVKRVMTEREILTTARHPFVVTMYASFQTTKRLCYVMEYCAAGELSKIIKRHPNGRIPEVAARFYTAEIVLALEYLHYNGFIYRDLKPENILMRADGHIALTDFDLAKLARAEPPRVVRSDSKPALRSILKRGASRLGILDLVGGEPALDGPCRSFVGTIEFLPPEVIQKQEQTSTVDWWTLGVLIYEMVVGCTPFRGCNEQDTFANITGASVRFPTDVKISRKCKRFIKALLIKDPTKRLGARGGAREVKDHPFLRNVPFAVIRSQPTPFKPKIHDPLDLKQYPPMGEEEPDESFDSTNVSSNDPFGNFTVLRSFT